MILDRFRKKKRTVFPDYEDGNAALEIGDLMTYLEDLQYLRESESYVDHCVSSRVKHGKEFRLSHLLVVSASLILCLLTFFLYLQTLSDYTKTKSEVNERTKSYQRVVSENAFLENEISKTTDYARVYEYATEELGMVLPEKRQILDYHVNREYVIKEGAIPRY